MKLAALAMLAVLPAMNAEDSPLMEGKLDSPVRVLIYEDLQCSDCALFRRMLDERLLPRYGARVAFEHRDFPLPKHNWARMAAIVSRYFQDGSRETALAWRRETLRDQKQITAATFAAYVQSFAARRGLDGAKVLAALTDERLNRLVSSDYEEGVARGIARTPTALVNGEPFIETFTVEQISAGIEKALAEAGVK